MSGNLPDGCTLADIDARFQKENTALADKSQRAEKLVKMLKDCLYEAKWLFGNDGCAESLDWLPDCISEVEGEVKRLDSGLVELEEKWEAARRSAGSDHVGSEELIHDARQVDLEDVIMTNETPMYLVPGQLTTEQREMFYRAVGNPAALENCISSIGAPIQPCADVETVGWGRETSFVDLKVPGCHAVSIHKEWEGGVPLVRRADMEAQVARMVSEKDAEIARLNEELSVYRAGFSELLAKEVDVLLKGGAA